MGAGRGLRLVGVVASAVFLVAPGLGVASHSNGQVTDVFRGPGIVLRYPGSLYVTNRPLDSITNPAQRFVLSTYRVPGNQPNADGNYTPPSTGVIAELTEDVPPPNPDFQAPPRPRQFALPKLSGHLETFGPRWGEIPFRDHGRGFYIFIGVGPGASPAKVALMLHTLDGLTVSAPPNICDRRLSRRRGRMFF